MEYDPKQLELLIHKVASTLGSRLEGLLFQQKNILENHLNNLMIDHNGQADSITPDEIIGAYEIATIHFLVMVSIPSPANSPPGFLALF